MANALSDPPGRLRGRKGGYASQGRTIAAGRCGIVNEVIDVVSRAEGLQLALIVAAMVLAESLVLTDLFVPGEVGLLIAGAAAADNGTPLVLVVGAASLGAVAGDSLGFVIGRRFGTSAIERWRWTRRLRPSLRRAKGYFRDRGGIAVAAARWVGALRAVLPVVAGAATMPVRRFLLSDAPSAVAWSSTIASLGWVWGDDIADLVDRVGLAVSVTAVAVVVGVIWWARRRHGRDRAVT